MDAGIIEEKNFDDVDVTTSTESKLDELCAAASSGRAGAAVQKEPVANTQTDAARRLFAVSRPLPTGCWRRSV